MKITNIVCSGLLFFVFLLISTPAQANEAPTTVGAIPAQTVAVGGDSLTVDVSSYFSDPDGDPLSYAFAFSDSSKMNASVTGSTVLFTGVAAGTVTVTVTATDTGDLTASQTFTLTVNPQPNRSPVTVGTIPDQSVTIGGSVSVNVSGYFNDPDGDALSYAFSSSDTNKLNASITGSTLLFTGVDTGTVTITVTATDASDLFASQTFSVAIGSQNRPPVAVGTIPDQSLAVGGAAVSVDVSSYFSDPDGDALSYAFSSSDTNKLNASITGSTLLFTGVDTGTVTITVTATDASDLFASQTFSVTVSRPNRAPVASGTIPDQTVTVGGDSLTIDASSYFSDPDGDSLSYSFSFSDSSKMNASVTGSTAFFTGVAAGTVTVTVTATDTGNLTATQTFTLTVSTQNQAPATVGTISDQTVTVGGSATTVDVSSYFSDPDNDTLTYTASSSDTAKVTVSVSNTTISITAVAAGTTTITVTATDPGSLTATQTFSVTASQPNHPPVAVGTIPDQSLAVGGASVSLDVSSYFNDPDSDALSYAFSSSDTNKLNASITGSTLLFTGVDTVTVTITVTATDTSDLFASQTFSVSIGSQNRPPVAVGTIPDQSLAVGGAAVSVDVSSYFNDPDGDALSYAFSSSDTNKLNASITGSTLLFTGVDEGSITITVTATDTSDLFASQTFSVAVSSQKNGTPVTIGTIPDQTVNIGDVSVSVDVSGYFSDPDGDALGYTFEFSDSSKMNASVTGSTVLFTGVAAGTVTVTVTATDTSNLTATQTFTLTVNAQNRTPTTIGTIPAQTMTVGDSVTTVDVSSYFSDADNDALTYTASSSDTAKATVSVSSATVSITGVATGTATITVTATDTGNLTTTQSFTVTVTQPNRAPVKSGKDEIPKQSMGSAAPVSVTDIDTYFTDPDGDPLTYSAASSDTTVATASVSSTTITVSRVTAALSGQVTITVTATDPGGLSATRTFTVTVEPLNSNRAPTTVGTIPNQTMTVDATTPSFATVDVSSYFSDPDSDTLTYTASSSDTTKVTVSVSNATITLTAAAAGTASITVTATDPSSLAATQTFSVTASHPNRAPTAVGTIPNQTVVIGGASVTLNLSSYFSDPDSNTLTYTASISDEQPVLPGPLVKMGVSNTLQTLSISAEQAEGSGTITVTATDPGNLSVTQTFTVTVTQPNRAPVKSSKDEIPKQDIDSATPVSVTDIDTYFTDPDGDTLTYTVASSDTNVATVSVSGTTVTVSRATVTSSGQITITVTATDPGGLSAMRTFLATVNPDPPNAASNGSPEAIKQDMNGDGVVNILDLVLVANQIGQPAAANAADVNGDGVVNILDLVLVASEL